MKSVKYDITYSEKASRLELVVRFFWMIPTVIVMFFLGIIFYIGIILQWLHILFLGKRQKTLHGLIFKFEAYAAKVKAYVMLLTDEKNPILPED